MIKGFLPQGAIIIIHPCTYSTPGYVSKKSKNAISNIHAPQESQHYLQLSRCRQTKCSLADEWIKNVWCMYVMEYYSAIKE